MILLTCGILLKKSIREKIDVKSACFNSRIQETVSEIQQLQDLVADGNLEIWTANEAGISSIICYRRFDIEKSLA